MDNTSDARLRAANTLSLSMDAADLGTRPPPSGADELPPAKEAGRRGGRAAGGVGAVSASTCGAQGPHALSADRAGVFVVRAIGSCPPGMPLWAAAGPRCGFNRDHSFGSSRRAPHRHGWGAGLTTKRRRHTPCRQRAAAGSARGAAVDNLGERRRPRHARRGPPHGRALAVAAAPDRELPDGRHVVECGRPRGGTTRAGGRRGSSSTASGGGGRCR